jgi:acetyl/propionyl-CoA carboxylase alpha subunit
VIEEAPAARVSAETRRAMGEAAVRLARDAGYRSAGTVEFLVAADGGFHFLEVNTRLQVEHPVTEMVSGMDLVKAQIEIARGGPLPDPPAPRGHAIEARLNAEDPYRGFLPQSGPILLLNWPQRPGIRIDAGIREGQHISSSYDSLLAKVIAWGDDREGSPEAAGRSASRTGASGHHEQPSVPPPGPGERTIQERGDLHHDLGIAGMARGAAAGGDRLRRPTLGVDAAGSRNGSVSLPTPWEVLGKFRVGQ